MLFWHTTACCALFEHVVSKNNAQWHYKSIFYTNSDNRIPEWKYRKKQKIQKTKRPVNPRKSMLPNPRRPIDIYTYMYIRICIYVCILRACITIISNLPHSQPYNSARFDWHIRRCSREYSDSCFSSVQKKEESNFQVKFSYLSLRKLVFFKFFYKSIDYPRERKDRSNEKTHSSHIRHWIQFFLAFWWPMIFSIEKKKITPSTIFRVMASIFCDEDFLEICPVV